jgi:hypothetical protein
MDTLFIELMLLGLFMKQCNAETKTTLITMAWVGGALGVFWLCNFMAHASDTLNPLMH